MEFDIREIPFSSYGSTFSISYIENINGIEDGLYIRNVKGGDNFISRLFRLDLVENGEIVSFKTSFKPTLFKLESSKGFVEFCIYENMVRIRGENTSLRLTVDTKAYDNAIPVGKKQWEVNSYEEQIKLLLTSLEGELVVDAPWNIVKSEYIVANFLCNENNRFDALIEAYETVWKEKEYDSFENCHEKIKKSYDAWMDSIVEVSDEIEKGRQLAGYFTWSCVVNPKGKLTRRAIYMSKNYMSNIWSWDNCFNAMALINRYPELAWDQIMIFFDNQDESGLIPDYINDAFASWSCTKPPIHGWAIDWMMKKSDFITQKKMEEVYEPLVNWTNWWFKYRDYDKDGIPAYNHGNDCGWDNSTVFNERPPIKSPDLLSYLVIQMDVLSTLAKNIGKKEEALYWKDRASKLLDKLIDYFYDGEKFVAKLTGSNKNIESNSLLLYMPIVLGDRLPVDIAEKLVEDLKEKGKFHTEYGLATERIDSPLYKEKGYWRGPIWAPTTMLIVDGLYNMGELDFAREIAWKFCRMASQGGMTENYNALTGEGLEENAFTMTSAVFLILAMEFFK
ncbi:amylo-alpha-1,6-glucosidase [Sporanaerobacter acetigenes]|uniref:amylo-alpha-1,6-glucosidase n=1 Tax=Sporanaerobacter acetigenes TaxID=165813 RepID=UPI00104F9DB6|nr:trehalase family glycosidase [Sporanaerobacter acetigenes]